ncbi:MAG TPA: hypothetical protein VJJ83_05115, partial [Candidatus Babeliales bacterium]|nr:hypothetical protein [Candidatus Babeliales bacterium]
MRHIKQLLNNYVLALLLLVSASPICSAPTIALLDTAGRDSAPYQQFIMLAQHTGCSVSYYGIDQLAATTELIFDQDLVLLICSPEFLSATAKQPLRQQILHRWRQRLQQHHAHPKLISGLALPTGDYRWPKTLTQLLRPLGLDYRARQQVKNFLRLNTDRKSIGYHTSLRLPTSTCLKPPGHYPSFCELPTGTTTQPISQALATHLPLGLYRLGSVNHKNSCATVLFPDWLLTALGPAENFHLVPQAPELRQELAQLLSYTLQQLSALMSTPAACPPANCDCQLVTSDQLTTPFSSALPTTSTSCSAPQLASDIGLTNLEILALSKTNDCDQQPSSAPPDMHLNLNTGALNSPLAPTLTHTPTKTVTIAWLELTAFTPLPITATPAVIAERSEQQQQLIQYLLSAKLDRLWLSLSPHMYLSPRARYAPQKIEFYQTLNSFYHQLTATAAQQQLPVPALYLGFEIANNLYPPHLPVPCAVDLFGHQYPDLPAPLDAEFWCTELLEPLQAVCQAVPEIPWAGIVLDLEMYLRQQT